MTSTLAQLLALETAPVAITFCDEPPAGVSRVARAEPASCGYWRRAAAGEVFYTAADDHLGCAVGAHTHAAPMGPEKQRELEGLIGTMVGLEYLSPAEIPQIPTRTAPLRYAVYAPLDQAPLAPDVVLVRGDVRQLMLIAEATQSAGCASTGPTGGRPTCAVLPDAVNHARAAASFGCVGNRVYTGAGNGEGYYAITGARLAALETRLAVVVRANEALERFHRDRLQTA